MIYAYIFLLMLFSWGVFYFVKYIPEKYLWGILSVLVVLMVVIAATKPDTSSDYAHYYHMFLDYDNPKTALTTEPTYIFLSQFLHQIGGNFDALLWIYALITIPLKIYCFKRLTSFEILFLALPEYYSFFFLLHDCEQIRLAAAMSLIMLAYVCRVEKKKWYTWIPLWLMAISFHYTTAVAIIPLLFYSSKDFSWKVRLSMCGLVCLGVVILYLKINLITILPIPALEAKMALYEVSISKGDQIESIPLLGYPVALLRYFTFFYAVFFYDTIRPHIKGFNIILMSNALGLFCWGGLSGIAIFAVRISELFQVTECILFASVLYTIRPRWIGKLYPIVTAIFIFLYGIIKFDQFGYLK